MVVARAQHPWADSKGQVELGVFQGMSLGALSRSHFVGDFNSFHTRAPLGAGG